MHKADSARTTTHKRIRSEGLWNESRTRYIHLRWQLIHSSSSSDRELQSDSVAHNGQRISKESVQRCLQRATRKRRHAFTRHASSSRQPQQQTAPATARTHGHGKNRKGSDKHRTGGDKQQKPTPMARQGAPEPLVPDLDILQHGGDVVRHHHRLQSDLRNARTQHGNKVRFSRAVDQILACGAYDDQWHKQVADPMHQSGRARIK